MKPQISRLLAVAILTIFCIGRPLMADVTGTVLGTVTDPSGAAVAAAEVRLTNPSTGLARTAMSNDAGYYEFLAVPVGENYVVEVEKSGFEKSTQTGINLLVNQKFRADFKLVLGSVSQKVEVSAQAVQAETTSTQLGDVIESQKMEAMPLNGRSFLDLLGLQVGVVPTISSAESTDVLVSGTYSVNGQREAGNSFQVNGGSVQHSYENGTAVQPDLDSIQEFRLLTSTFDAEYGRFSGAVVNVVTKSGTNGLHGDIFEFLRNDKLDSRGFFDRNVVNPVTEEQIPGSALPKLERNQFGGTLGGPIKKNRLFFFGDYQGTRQLNGESTGNITVPSANERQGNFSDLGTTGFAPLTGSVRVTASAPGTMDQVLSQRLGYTVTPAEPYYVQGCNTAANAQAGMCVFPGDVIPQVAWSPAAKGTIGFIPMPTFLVGGVPYFSSSNARATANDDRFSVRLDLMTQRTGSWFVYYNFDNATTLNSLGSNNTPGFPTKTRGRPQNVNLSNTLSFGGSAVNEARLVFTRSEIATRVATGPFGDITKWGFVKGGLGIVPGIPALESTPKIGLNETGVSFGSPGGPLVNPGKQLAGTGQLFEDPGQAHNEIWRGISVYTGQLSRLWC